MPVLSIGLTPMSPTIEVVPVVEMPVFVRITKLPADPRFMGARPASGVGLGVEVAPGTAVAVGIAVGADTVVAVGVAAAGTGVGVGAGAVVAVGLGAVGTEGFVTALASNVTAVCDNALPFSVAPVFIAISV